MRSLLPLAALIVFGCANTVELFAPAGDGGGGGDPTGPSSSVGPSPGSGGTPTGVGAAGGSPDTSSGIGAGGSTPTSSGVAAGGSPSTSSGGGATPTSSGVGGSPATTGVGAFGGSPATSSTGAGATGAGGGGPTCGHDFCDVGPALNPICDPCVTQICQQDSFCCNNFWDNICVGHVANICMIDCFPIGMGPCGMQYPNSPVCDDTSTCVLAHNSTQSSCQALCASGGGECLGAFNDFNNQTCMENPNAPYPCQAQVFTSVVCVCSQGCGGGPPCPLPQTCVMGQCQ